MVDGPNLYEYSRSNPMRFFDVTGRDSETRLDREIKKAITTLNSLYPEDNPQWGIWREEYYFLKSLKGIHDYQLDRTGVALKVEKYPVTRKDGEWVFDPEKNQYFTGGGFGSEYPGGFCLGSARNFGMRVLFGKDLPSYRQQLAKHKARIEDFKSKSMARERAEEFIKRIESHTNHPKDMARFNKGLAERYENKIGDVAFVSSNSRREAWNALREGSPVMVGSGYHWVMVVRSPRGQLWKIDSYTNDSSGVTPISSSEFEQLGGYFEFIVDAATKAPIGSEKASEYRR
jgi:hypothetical protein